MLGGWSQGVIVELLRVLQKYRCKVIGLEVLYDTVINYIFDGGYSKYLLT